MWLEAFLFIRFKSFRNECSARSVKANCFAFADPLQDFEKTQWAETELIFYFRRLSAILNNIVTTGTASVNKVFLLHSHHKLKQALV